MCVCVSVYAMGGQNQCVGPDFRKMTHCYSLKSQKKV